MTARSRAINLDENPSFFDLLNEHNKLVDDLYYNSRNGSGSTAPVVATATVTSKVKTTNNTTYYAAGQPIAKAATDNLWTLTGGVLAAASFRKYRLLLDTAGTATVQASSDSLVSAALCDFSTRPADGVAIVGELTVATDATHTFTPATTLLGAAGITATYIDGSDSLELLASKIVT